MTSFVSFYVKSNLVTKLLNGQEVNVMTTVGIFDLEAHALIWLEKLSKSLPFN